MSATDLSTFWILFGRYGVAMTLEQLRDQFYPSRAMRTMQNRRSAGDFPPMVGEVFDTRAVADWWDAQRQRAA
jgi:alpha/beta superfamily hydrolase